MNQKIPLGLAYDDVLLIPQHSHLESRSEVDLSTQITPRIKIKLPIISVNMSDVTGVDMAIALGKLGGLGFLHRFNSPEEEADMVAKVKSVRKVEGVKEILVPGERGNRLAKQRLESGEIKVEDNLLAELRKIGQ